jgi:uncharacterized Zn-finger protein
MSAMTSVDQQLIESSIVIQQEELQRKIKCQCKDCTFETTSRGSIANHLKSVHMGIKYPCRQCDYQATTNASLTRHQQAVHMGRKHPCQECGQQFTQKSSLTTNQSLYTWVKDINVNNVTTRQHKKEI